MPVLSVTPTTATPGQNIDVDGSAFDPTTKFSLATVDATGRESGRTSNSNRPKADGAFSVGILVPSLVGATKIRAYQRSVVVASADVTVKAAVPLPTAPTQFSATPGNGSVALVWQP